MRKLFLWLFVCLMFFSLLVPLVSAAVSMTSAVLGATSTMHKLYSVAPNDLGGYAASFEANTEGFLYSADFYLKKVNSPDLTLNARLVNSSTGLVSGYAMFEEVLAESTNTIEATDLSTSYEWYTFNFNSTYEIHVSDVFFIVLYASSYTTGDSTNYVGVSQAGAGGIGYSRRSTGSVIFTSGSSNDYNYKVWVSDVEGAPTPTPSPTSTASPDGSGDAMLEYWGDIVATWIFPILLVLVPAVIAAYYLGKIGFIIGLNIGMILGYAALPNIFGLWTVIMLVLVDIGYFFFARG